MRHSSLIAAILARTGRLRNAFGLMTLGVTALLALGSLASHAQTYTEQTLHSFGSGTDGQSPHASLILVNGIFYGTTIYGGTSNKGTIFSFDPATNTETTLYSFSGPDGYGPFAALLNVNGILYGTTNVGGSHNLGTIFSYNIAAHTEAGLHDFAGPSSDGSNPEASLIDVGGILYGTTVHGGFASDRRFQGDLGTTFSFDPATNTEATLVYFLGNNNGGYGDYGSNPVAGLLDVNGILYGTTRYGGDGYDNGEIFGFDPANPNNPQQGYHFSGSNGADGAEPLGGLINVNGLLYGTTYNGGTSTNSGTVYSYDPTTSAVTTLYNFTGDGTNGAAAGPSGDLIYDTGTGRLFGTTQQGGIYTRNYGSSYSAGTVYSLDPISKRVQLVYSFNDYSSHTDGTTPSAGLIDVNGTLYGTAQSGGVNGKGTIFAIKITAGAPTAANDTYAPKYQTAFAVKAPGVLANDNNGGDHAFTAALVSQPTHGTLTLYSDGSFKYTPSAGFAGADSFTYQDTNSAGTSNIATVTLNVQPVAPVAASDIYAPKYQTAFAVKAPGVLANDSNGGSTPLTAALVSNVSNGTLTLNSDGSFTYTPNAGYVGADSFTYQATNSVGTSNTATITLNVIAVVPTARNDAYTAKYATAYAVKAPGVLGNDTNGDNATMTAALVSQPGHGTLTFNADGSFTYTPSAGFVGMDSFTYQAVDPIGHSSPATVTLNVTAASPIAHNDAYTIPHNTTYAVKAPGVLANDYAGTSGSFIAVQNSPPSHGTVTFNNDGSFTYVPNAGYSGTDGFSYYDTTSVGASNIATITLTVQ